MSVLVLSEIRLWVERIRVRDSHRTLEMGLERISTGFAERILPGVADLWVWKGWW